MTISKTKGKPGTESFRTEETNVITTSNMKYSDILCKTYNYANSNEKIFSDISS